MNFGFGDSEAPTCHWLEFRVTASSEHIVPECGLVSGSLCLPDGSGLLQE
jgi:hypothetical protein